MNYEFLCMSTCNSGSWSDCYFAISVCVCLFFCSTGTELRRVRVAKITVHNDGGVDGVNLVASLTLKPPTNMHVCPKCIHLFLLHLLPEHLHSGARHPLLHASGGSSFKAFLHLQNRQLLLWGPDDSCPVWEVAISR